MELKATYDALVAANAEVLRVANAIEAAFEQGDEEGRQKALGMRAELDAAQTKAAEIDGLYGALQDVVKTDPAKLFVPTGEKTPDARKTINRAAFDAMSNADRHAFFKSGGQVVDEAAE